MTSLDDDLDRDDRLPPGAVWISGLNASYAPTTEPWETQPTDPAQERLLDELKRSEAEDWHDESTPAYLNAEQNEILGTFLDLLRGPTGDGAVKRDRGEKVLWKFDTSHRDAMMRHLTRWIEGEDYDEESGAPALCHVAWRALALAWQQLDRDGLIR